MAEPFLCKKCGKPMRAHAKFCPHCGEKASGENASGILSYDDFFDDEPAGKSEELAVEQPRPETQQEPPAPEEPEVPGQPADLTDAADATDETASPKTIFTFRDRERKRKVKMLEDTLELPIEEIQREIARRRERERLEMRSPEEKEAGRQEMSSVFDRLKEKHDEPDVLIPESEIVRSEDRQEKKSLFSRARNYLLGVDTDDIEGVDVKKEEALEEKKIRRAAAGKEPVEPEAFPDTRPAVEAEFEEIPADTPVLSVPKDPAGEAPEPKRSRIEALPEQAEQVSKSTWYGTLFDRKRKQKEEELVISPFDESKPGSVQADAEEPARIAEAVEPASFPKTTGEKTKRRNIMIGTAAALLLVAGIALFFTGNYMSDPLRLTESFITAVEADDADAMAGLLTADGTQVTAAALGPFQEMLRDPEYKQALLADLNTFNTERGRSDDGDVWIEESGSRYLFFNAYQLHIKSFHVEPSVSYPDTMVSVDGGEAIVVSPDQPASIGPLLPGAHQITSVYEKGLNPLHAAKTVELTSTNEELDEGKLTVDLTNPGKFASFTSAQEEAVLLLNGEEKGKVKDLGRDGMRFGPFEAPVSVQLRLDAPLGTVLSATEKVDADGQKVEFTFPNMVEISDYHDEATIWLNGESKGVKGKDLIPFHRLIGPVKPEDTIQMEMEIDGRMTKSNVVTVGDQAALKFSYWKAFEFPWRFADAIVSLDGVDTGQSVYQLAGDDMTAELLNSYETIKLTKKYPWGTFESNTVALDEAGALDFTINPMNSTLYRQLQDAVVTHLEEDAFAISNLKPDNYSNIEDPLLSARRSYIQNLIDEKTRIVRVSDTANFDMNSIQFDDEDTYYARITETYTYHYQEYEAGIFRPIRLEMKEATEVMQHAMRYDKSAGKWFIYDNRPKESMGQSNVETVDLAY